MLMNRNGSKEMYRVAQTLIPGGVNSPVRSFRAVDDFPSFIQKAKGSKLWDVDGNEYIDYIMSWGAVILGHAHEEVVQSVCEAAQRGFGYGASTEGENLLAKRILSALPAMDLVRFVSSGTEACMTAIRIARGYTQREKFVKFTGNYHGHSDPLLVAAGSGIATFSLPSSKGVPQSAVENTLVAPYNNLNYVKELFRLNKGEIAAVMLEPFVGNAGFIRPSENFLQGLRDLCSEEGALLIFDEVMTGFRVCWGGVQNLVNIAPDLSTFAKVIGGGMPLAAVGGKKEIMSHLAPLGDVYQAGTLSGNPIAVACGLKTLEILGKEGTYARLTKTTQTLLKGISEIAAEYGIKVQVDGEGGMFGIFFSDEPVRSFEDAKKSDSEMFKKFFKGLLNRGIYWAPSLFEAGFISLAHTEDDIFKTIDIIEQVFRDIA